MKSPGRELWPGELWPGALAGSFGRVHTGLLYKAERGNAVVLFACFFYEKRLTVTVTVGPFYLGRILLYQYNHSFSNA